MKWNFICYQKMYCISRGLWHVLFTFNVTVLQAYIYQERASYREILLTFLWKSSSQLSSQTRNGFLFLLFHTCIWCENLMSRCIVISKKSTPKYSRSLFIMCGSFFFHYIASKYIHIWPLIIFSVLLIYNFNMLCNFTT